jgi:PII-like signaling protein
MNVIDDGRLLRIFICESDEFDGRPLDEVVLDRLRLAGICGATVLRGVAGYGRSSIMHTTHILRLSEDLPTIIEAVDTREKIESVLPELEEVIGDGVITLQEIEIHTS